MGRAKINWNQSQSLMASNFDDVGVLQEKLGLLQYRAQHVPDLGVRAAECLAGAAGHHSPTPTR